MDSSLPVNNLTKALVALSRNARLEVVSIHARVVAARSTTESSIWSFAGRREGPVKYPVHRALGSPGVVQVNAPPRISFSHKILSKLFV